MIDADDVPPSIRQNLQGGNARLSAGAIAGILSVAVLAGAVAVYYYVLQKPGRDVAPPVVAPVVRVPVAPISPPVVHFPVAQPDQQTALPTLSESDHAILLALFSLWNPSTLAALVHRKEFIRHVVVTIDNLPRASFAIRLSPIKPVPGRFLTTDNDPPDVEKGNALRYASYVKLLSAVDVKQLVALYVRFFPLFQRAYQDLGYPNGYFNDRLVEVLDNLLGAPEPEAPVHLVQPRIFFEYADPKLEVRSSGQKIMMRMGRENETKVKIKLHEIRDTLTREGPSASY